MIWVFVGIHPAFRKQLHGVLVSEDEDRRGMQERKGKGSAKNDA